MTSDRPDRAVCRHQRWALVGLTAFLALAACRSGDSAPNPGEMTETTAPPTVSTLADSDPAPTGPRRGVALSPRSFTSGDVEAFADHAAEAGSVLAHVGDWAELGAEESGFSLTLLLADREGLDPLLVVSPSSTEELLRPLDDPTRAGYLDALEAYLVEHRPEWVGVGNEVNWLASADPDAFEEVVALFADAAAVAAEVSPETKVFPVLQYEWLRGDRGGLIGREPAEDQWHLLDRFGAASAVGFTTYPFLTHPDPTDLPDDYYSSIADHTPLPVVFTEVGWSAEPIDGFGGDEEEQAAFVSRFTELTAPLRPEVMVWPFVFDPELVPFDATGLRRPDGTPRPAWHAWVER